MYAFRRTWPIEAVLVESVYRTGTTPLSDLAILPLSPLNSLNARAWSWSSAVTDSTELQFWSFSAIGWLANLVPVWIW